MIHQSDIERVTGNRRYLADLRAEKRAHTVLWWLLFSGSLGVIVTVSLIWGRR